MTKQSSQGTWQESPKFGIRPTKVCLEALPLVYFLTLGKLLNLFKPQFTLFIRKNKIIILCFTGDTKTKIDAYLLCKPLK